MAQPTAPLTSPDPLQEYAMIIRKGSGLLIWAILLAGITAAGIWIMVSRAALQISNETGYREGMILPTREVSGTVQSPEISLIDSPSATCSRPAAGTDICYIGWSYLNVTATPDQYMISMTVAINNRLRAYFQGFFQTAMYIPGDLLGTGFRVPCGAPDAGGVANLGYTYSYTIRAKETGGLGAANYGSITCPADIVSLSNLSLTGPTAGIVGRTYTFDASVIPITATLPITYTWAVTDHSISEVVTGTNMTAALSWSTAGHKTVWVSAENLNSTVNDSLSVAVRLYYGVYLPLLRK